ncbi:MAG: hypothetical protein HOE86_14010 [Gemmatimonadetes bacterium]|nr:hypothetical protein [Gemmatimonadota bacterium]
MSDTDTPRDDAEGELAQLRLRIQHLETQEEDFKRVKEELARLATFPEQNPNPVIETDLQGTVTFLNPAAHSHFPDLQAAGLDHALLADLQTVIASLRDGSQESSLVEMEIGENIYGRQITCVAQSDLVRIFAHDITSLKKAEASLTRLATFPEQNPNPVIEMAPAGDVTYLNPAAREHFPDLSTLGPNHPLLAGLDEVIASLQSGTLASSLVEIDIGARIYERKATFMRETQLLRIFAYDMTEQKHLQAQLQTSLADLEQTNKDLMDTQVQLVQSEKMAAMASLVAGIAHEINTPIGAIASVYDTLIRAVGKLKEKLGEGSADDPRQAGVAAILQIIANASDVIRTGSERVVAIVDSMRSFARLDEAELKSVNIQDGLDDTVSLVQHRLGDRIDLIREYDASDPIVCYPGRLNQVFLCILDNAIDAIDGKGSITIATRREDDQLLVAITDSGQGIPAAKLDEVFQPGYTTKGVGVGTGLGLSICHQIVHDHRGTIKADSEIGKGTTLTTMLSYNFTGMGPGR